MSNQSITSSSGFGSRYKALIVFIALFVFSVVSVMVLNLYISSQFSEDALEINIAGRQRMLSQRIMKSLFDVQTAQQLGDSLDAPFLELQQSFELFDNTLSAFDQSGETQNTSGETIFLEPVESPQARQIVNNAQALWKTNKSQINRLLVDATSAQFQTLSDTNQSVLDENEALLANMNELTVLLESQKADRELINLAGRQRLLSQLMAKQLYQLSSSHSNDSNFELVLNRLRETVSLFDTTLLAFSKGGAVINANGQPINIRALDAQDAQLIITRTVSQWEPLKQQFDRLLGADALNLKALSDAVASLSSSNIDMLELMNQFTLILQNESQNRSNILRLIQVLGIAISLIMFFIVLFYFVRQLRKNDLELDQAKAETDRIMETVNDGLFLMDNDYVISNQHSRSITKILNQETLAGKDFLSVLRKIVPEKTLSTAQDYIKLLFGDRVNEELVADLNPLDMVEVNIDAGSGEYQTKFLEFAFKRTKVDGKISQLLVQVDDISQKVILEKQLEESKEKAGQQFELMLSILHVEPSSLAEFLTKTEQSLHSINDILSERSSGVRQSISKVDRIFRMMHGIKGDASMLGLDVFVDKAHDFENALEGLRNNETLDGMDFLPLTVRLDAFLNQTESVMALIEQLTQLKKEILSDTDAEGNPPEQNTTETAADKLSQYSGQLAKRQGKLVTFSLFGENTIPKEYNTNVMESLVQFLRNSVAHGIESPAERLAAKKPIQGSIRACFRKLSGNDGYELNFHDDGQGLCPKAIKKTAITNGFITQDQADRLNDKEIISLIFKPGFSNISDANEDAGRGVGMDVIKAKINGLGGQLKLRYSQGKYCEFIALFPALNTLNTANGEPTYAPNDR